MWCAGSYCDICLEAEYCNKEKDTDYLDVLEQYHEEDEHLQIFVKKVNNMV